MHSDVAASGQGSADIGPPPDNHRSDCNICRKQDGLHTGSALLDTPIPGGYIVEGEYFLVEHAAVQSSGPGTVIVEARRHLLDFGEMTPTESAQLGSLLDRLVPVLKSVTDIEGVYYLERMERPPHFHLWLAPRRNEGDLRGVQHLAHQPPLTTSPSEAETVSQKIRAACEAT